MATAKIQWLSGANCRFFLKGRCLKLDPLTPEDDRMCLLVVERQKMGRKTLDRLKRLERFGLSIHSREGSIARRYIVEKNLEEMAKIYCKNYIATGTVYPACRHQYQIRCLLKAKICEGRCPEFQRGEKSPS